MNRKALSIKDITLHALHGTGCLKLRAHVAAASQEGQP